MQSFSSGIFCILVRMFALFLGFVIRISYTFSVNMKFSLDFFLYFFLHPKKSSFTYQNHLFSVDTAMNVFQHSTKSKMSSILNENVKNNHNVMNRTITEKGQLTEQ